MIIGVFLAPRARVSGANRADWPQVFLLSRVTLLRGGEGGPVRVRESISVVNSKMLILKKQRKIMAKDFFNIVLCRLKRICIVFETF